VNKDSLTDLQLAVMKALWAVGPATVADVTEALTRDGRTLAPTTVATMLQRLAKQGWVAHEREGRQFVYRADVPEQEAAQGMLRRVLSGFFGGKVSALTAHLLTSEDVSSEDWDEIRKLVNVTGPKNKKGKGR
jgi:predicted transcriptional regulator